MKITLPISPGSKEDAVTKEIAGLLCREGVPDMMALPTAIDVLVLVKKRFEERKPPTTTPTEPGGGGEG